MELWAASNLIAGSGRGRSGTNLRTETISVRLEPRVRYMADLAARAQRRTLSSFIEFAIDNALSEIGLTSVDGDYQNLRHAAPQLWDPFEPDRFVKLALRFPDLLNHHEQILWKLIKENGLLWKGGHSKLNGEWTWRVEEASVGWPRLRDNWELFNKVASGEVDLSELPTWRKYPVGDPRNGTGPDDDEIPL